MAFKVFNADKKIENQYSTVAEPMWSTGGVLTTFFTGSTQDSNAGKYYYNIHATDDQTQPVEFAISYGHRQGSGSEGSSTAGTTNPTKAIYSQIRQVLLPSQTEQFNFNGGGTGSYPTEDILVIAANATSFGILLLFFLLTNPI